MKLLLRREQSNAGIGRVTFKLWARTELDENEEHLIRAYRFDSAKLIDIFQPGLARKAALVGVVACLIVTLVLNVVMGPQNAFAVGIVTGIGVGWLFHDRNRESIYVRDLIHGRHFTCTSVVDLARKEAWLAMVVSFLRQVMESAKHWDGTETIPIEALSKQEAKFIAVKGL